MSTTSEELKKLYKKLGGDEENIRKASTPAEILNGINELDIGSAIMSDAKIEDLKDVEIVSPVKGETIEFDGEKWVNVDKPDMSVVKSVSGNPVEFNDGANTPLVKCVTEIQGSQDLHGYDKPWVGGAGKNKLPLVLSDIKALNTSGTWSGNDYTWNGITFSIITDNGENITGINVNGTASALSYLFLQNETSDFSVFAGKSCILNGCPANGSTSTYTLSTYGSGMTTNDVGSGTNVTFPSTTPNAWNIAINIISGYTANNLKFYPMLRLSTETDPTFAPYSNICPITAYTEGEIEVSSANPCNNYVFTEGAYIDNSGIVQLNPLYKYVTALIEVVPSTTYTIRIDKATQEALAVTIPMYKADGSFISREMAINPTTSTGIITGTFTTTADTYYIRFSAPKDSSEHRIYTTTHTTTYPSAIFRGSEDVVNGEVTSEKVKIQSDGTGFLIANNGILYNDSNILTGVSSVVADLMQIITDKYAFFNIIGGTVDLVGQEGKFGLQIIGNVIRIAICDSRFTTAEDFRTYLANNPLEIAYELATPTTSSVTPTNLPVKSLYGYNHIESSTGDLDIDYINGAYDPLIQVMSKQVVANPTDAASETLTGLKVGDTTYSVPQGGGGSIQRMLMNNTITIE